MLRRIAYSLTLAGLCLAVLATRVAPGFERIRIRVVTSPIAAGAQTIVVPLPDLSRLATAPAAIIVRAKGATDSVALRVTLDDIPITRAELAATRDVRLDASAMVPPGAGHQMVFAGDRPDWQLTYVEIANVYGYSGRLVSFVIVPRERPHTDSVPVWLLGILGVLAVAARPRLDWLRRPAYRWVYRVGIALTLVFFVATLVADRVSPYRILLSLDSFLLLAGLLYADPLVRLARAAWPTVRAKFPRIESYLPHAAVLGLVLWSVGLFYRADAGFTPLIMFGQQFERTALPILQRTPHAVDPGSGYDGQFYAQIALDPLLRSQEIIGAIDDAAYRSRRVLLPWVAWLLGMGQPYYVLQAYALLNVVSWLLLGLILLRWLPAGSMRRRCRGSPSC